MANTNVFGMVQAAFTAPVLLSVTYVADNASLEHQSPHEL